SDEAEDAPARDHEAVREMLATTRERGYAIRDPQVRPVSRSLAVPIVADGRVVATVGMTYFSSVLDDATAAENHLGDLQQLSAEIVSRLRALDRQEYPPATPGIAAPAPPAPSS